MGIPALFRWLSTKYPKVTSQCVEHNGSDERPLDLSSANPNGEEFDNLYLDMNGIIHPCCHPEDKPAPNTEDEMMLEIFRYIDRILAIIRPRKVLFMAIDGVAPRAKMNQQRSRRFRASQEAQEKADEEEKLKTEWEAKHGPMDVEGGKKTAFDSNCITPGTPFMTNLAEALKYYISDRLNKEPAFKDLKIILSDASVPGEGEHKIMDFIRRERTQKDFNPNTSHVLYGLDADLIMLALATHEPHFKILREDVFFNQRDNNRGCFICGQTNHQASECTGKKKEKNGEFDEKKDYVQKPYVFLHVSILREYLAAELFVGQTPFPWNLERAIDDWVFLCFFVGNDFLPHIPSLEIREGAIDTLIEIWKRNLHTFNGYITNCGDIDLSRAQILLMELGKVEDQVFVKRRLDEERKRENQRRRKEEAKARAAGIPKVNAAGFDARKRGERDRIAVAHDMSMVPAYSVKNYTQEVRAANLSEAEKNAANKAAADFLKKSLMGGAVSEKRKQPDEVEKHSEPAAKKVVIESESAINAEEEEEVLEEGGTVSAIVDDDDEEEPAQDVVVLEKPPVKKVVDDDEEPEDNVRLWEPGWKKRYYERKFHVDEGDKIFIRQVVTKYVEGFCWVLKYYYQGCQSWKWYYPYHYSPFASDFDFIATLNIEFELGEPFNPIEQLMGVFPAASRQHIPTVFHSLMLDEKSPIIDFYPEKFPLDLNGKKYAWQGVALLPFIDESRLLAAMTPLYAQLSEQEVQRNTRGSDLIYCREGNALFEDICAVYGKADKQPVPLNPRNSDHLLGYLLPDPNATMVGSILYNPLESLSDVLPDISDTRSMSGVFIMPHVPASGKYPSILLKGVKMPETKLTPDDVLWIKMGGIGSGRGRGRGRGRGGNHAANRFIQHGIGSNAASNLPYMGGGGYSANVTYGEQSYNSSYSTGFGSNNDRTHSFSHNSSFSSHGGNDNIRNSYNSQNRQNHQNNNSSSIYTSNSGGYNVSYQSSAYTRPMSQGASLYGQPQPSIPHHQPMTPPGYDITNRPPIHFLPPRPPGGFIPPPNLAWNRNLATNRGSSQANGNLRPRGGSGGYNSGGSRDSGSYRR